MQKSVMLKKRFKSTVMILCNTLEKQVKQMCFSRLYSKNKIHYSITNHMVQSMQQASYDHSCVNL